jgi:hypothetical protein
MRIASIIALVMEAVHTSETSAGYVIETTRRYIPEGCNLQKQSMSTAVLDA